jgi:hypothetical protein
MSAYSDITVLRQIIMIVITLLPNLSQGQGSCTDTRWVLEAQSIDESSGVISSTFASPRCELLRSHIPNVLAFLPPSNESIFVPSPHASRRRGHTRK